MTHPPARARLIRFALVGITTAGIYYGLAWLLFANTGAGALVASSIACVTALVFNYRAHYHWTFAAVAPHGSVLARYLVMVSLGTVLNGAIMYWGVDVRSGNFFLVQSIAAVSIVAWNLCLSNWWVFKAPV
ncbi:MAG: GtrA family protein [Gammaproteobacteria bacterium]|nr:GtrA family protein [Gammaproteobacteria bacterium]